MKKQKRRAPNGTWDVLVIVDLQKAFPVSGRFLECVERYAKRFRRRVFTRFENRPGSLFRRALKQDCCAPGSADLALWLKPRPGDVVITKQSYGFLPKDIRRLRRLGVKRATVCGLDTDACVLAVMFSLFDAGIECHAKADLCLSTSGRALHRAALRIIEQQFPPPK